MATDAASSHLMLRPKNITPGNVPLVSNLLQMNIPDITVCHYAVSIEPLIAKRLNNVVVRNVLESNRDKFSECVYGYDGNAMIVTSKKIEDIVQQEKVGTKEFTVSVEYKNSYTVKNNQVPTDSLESTMQCLEILLRSYQSEKYHVDGRRIVTSTKREMLSGCVEIWFGLSQRIKLLNNSLFLNIDVSHVLFYEPLTLIQLIEKQQTRRYNDTPDLSRLSTGVFRDLSKFLKMLRLETTHRKRNIKFRACDVTETSATDTFFSAGTEAGTEDAKQESVAEYFERVYGPLKHPYLPCVVVKKRDGHIYFPLEVVKIVSGQKYTKRLNDFQTSELIKKVSMPAHSRFKDMQDRMQSLEVCSNPLLSGLNLRIDSSFYTTMGKQLNPPDIQFHSSTCRPNRGSWNLRNVKLVKTVAIQKWSVFVLADESPQRISRDLNTLIDICKSMGMKMARPMEVRRCSLNEMEGFIRDKGYELVMVVLSDRSAHNYQEVKRICDLNCDVISQCITRQKIGKLTDPSFCANIALKLNSKLGGSNYHVHKGKEIDEDMVMFGIDVTHPGTGDMSNHSIAAVVSSINEDFTRYHTTLRLQERRAEIIEDLNVIVKDHLCYYRLLTKKIPKKILVFRDGVGDSSLQTVYFREIEQIKKAFKELNENYSPSLTFVIVQKKHSIRFKGDGKGEYVKDPRRGPTCNPMPGTLVDSLGTKYNDFYLISHFALQGTPCPVKYHVLIDEIQFEHLTQFIYNQCHTFSRATKAVSVVPVIYYAHLAAARAKCYVQDDKLLEVSDAFKNVLWYV